MRVKCIGNRGVDLPPLLVPTVAFPNTEYDLKLGAEYTVYAISMWKYVYDYLILTEQATSPSWYPGDLFEIIDPKIPKSWNFHYFGSREQSHPDGLMALCGYQEFMDFNHYIDLAEVEPSALEVFWKRKREIDADMFQE